MIHIPERDKPRARAAPGDEGKPSGFSLIFVTAGRIWHPSVNLLQALANAIRLPELRNRILFTGGMLVVFRLFANVAVPGASQAALAQLFNNQALLGLLDLFSGGGLSRFSVVAMGMNPYINATIIMQLMTVISERIKEISKEGEMGRRRITRWSRYLTVAL